MDQLVDALVPGMPPAARAKITRQAQGIPLFAVETVRSLIDRDIVRPVERVYRLTGDVGELTVPDSLHALLVARLDALDPGARRLVADAAVLGTTFPAERAERTGAPAQAADSYAAAAGLNPPEAANEATAGLWERAARAAGANASHSAAIEYAKQARDIAGRLRCQPLLDRVDALTPRDPATVAPQVSPRVAR